MVVIGIIWTWIFDPNIGLLNQVLHIHINWLYDSKFAMPALIIVSVWKLIGYNMIIFCHHYQQYLKVCLKQLKLMAQIHIKYSKM